MERGPGEPAEWRPPDVFEEYRVVRALGRGAMGHVYLAHDTLLDRPVAVKFIAAAEPDADTRERFFIEARAVARLQHPNVVAVYRVGEVRGRPYLISEYLRGESLDQLKKPLPWRRVLEIGIELARGLAAAHRRGVLHRDIKPANAMLTEDGGLKLLDFGLAKLFDAMPHSAEIAGVVEQTLAGKLPAGVVIPPATPAENAAAIDRVHQAFAQPGATVDLPAPPDAAPPTQQDDMDSGETRIRASAPEPLPPPQVEVHATMDLPGDPRDAAASPRLAALGRQSPERASLTEAGAVLGSPLYMAPEAWRSDPATTQTDVYSFGALLYELAAGRAPWAGHSIPAIAANALTREVPALRSVAPEVDPALAAVIDRCLRREPAERWESGETLREALEQLEQAAPVAHLAPAENPYRGLMAFEAEHRSLFFGRGAEVRAILDRLRADPWVAVAGDSGVGKSSLCRAGVLPAVQEGALGGEPPRVITLVPGRRPLASFAAVLAPVLARDEAEVAEGLRKDPNGIARELRKRLPRGLFIFVDQLEELVTLADREEARALSEALAPLVLPASGVRLLTTARSDFLGRLAAAPSLGDGLSRALFLLKPLSAEGIREAIVAPARAAGFGFETEAMVNTLVESTTRTDGSLPLLQFALSELWSARDPARRVIPAEALVRLGGVEGALAKYADSVLEGFVGPMRATARRILLKLVTAEGTRARRSEAELLAGDPDARPALEALVHGRLLIARDTEEGEGSYEVAHEALISGWGTLREWLSANLETRAARQRLESAAKEWERLGRSRDALWSARQLEESRAVNEEDLGPLEREFRERSRRELRRRRLRNIAAIAAVPLVVASVAIGVRVKAARDLQAEVDQRMARANAAIATAERVDADAVAARTRAFSHFEAGRSSAGEVEWDVARKAAQAADEALGEAHRFAETALSLDPANAEVRERVAGIALRRVKLAQRERDKARLAEQLRRLQDYDRTGQHRRQVEAPAPLRLRTQPEGATASLAYYDEESGRLTLGSPSPLGQTPVTAALEPRSLLLFISAPGHEAVRYPLVPEAGVPLELELRLPRAGTVPAGFSYVPAGAFLYGSDEDDEFRRGFLDAVPMHERRTGEFLVKQTEVTFAEWMEFLRALPEEERARRMPKAAKGQLRDALELRPVAGGTFELRMTPTSRPYQAREGEPIRYQQRTRLSEVDWRQLPVGGVSYEDARAYAAWLHETGRLPRARLCREDEWEKAGRGADGRTYPCGALLTPEDGNFDETYGRLPDAFGPDPVGSHPSCPSPFGLYDVAGNVWELMDSVTRPVLPIIRGGSYFMTTRSGRIANRNVGEARLRDPAIGFRVCADVVH